MLHLLGLPSELLNCVAYFLAGEKDINSLAQTSRRLYNITNPYLYRFNAVHSQLSALLWAAKHGIIITAQHSLNSRFVGADAKQEAIHHALSIAAEAGHTGVAAFLLSQEGVDPNLQYQGEDEPRTMTILARAAKEGHMDMVELLLSTNGIDVNLGDEIGRSPLAYAGFKRQDSVLQRLLTTPGVDADLKDEYDRTPLCWTVQYGTEKAVSQFLSRPDVDINAAQNIESAFKAGWTILMVAVAKQLGHKVRLLLEVPGIDVNRPNRSGGTALHLAAKFCDDDFVGLLLLNGADPDPRDQQNHSPLFWSAWSGNLRSLKLLHEAGAPPHITTSTGDTPLGIALKRGHRDIVRYLEGIVNTEPTF